ncbi:MAG: diguanylate cyclase domain-containing protein [Aquabacterium sp.]|uniref:diguanylate cyclase domain-containing protein n=1 Tax=Aquabacterium sp. TaxID=1872578 RepID=UPI003BC26B5D
MSLIHSVKCRLRTAKDAGQHPQWDTEVQDWISKMVESCEPALDQLQRALEHEHARRQQLEIKAFEARTDFDQLRAELDGSRADESRARHQALHDSLTALPNRHYFCQRLTQALTHATLTGASLAVFFIDLDGFKAVNDTHGHAVGDELLGVVAARLMRAVRSEDMVGRLGGDEFACLLLDAGDHAQLSSLACKMYDSVSSPVKLGDLFISVPPSIGIARFPQCGQTSDMLLRAADMAMYQAKREHTGYAFYADPHTGNGHAANGSGRQ